VGAGFRAKNGALVDPWTRRTIRFELPGAGGVGRKLGGEKRNKPVWPVRIYVRAGAHATDFVPDADRFVKFSSVNARQFGGAQPAWGVTCGRLREIETLPLLRATRHAVARQGRDGRGYRGMSIGTWRSSRG